MVAPGLLDRMISPAILLAKISRVLGDTDMAGRSIGFCPVSLGRIQAITS
jgi:hypothetical protein